MTLYIPREWVDTSNKKLFKQCVLTCGSRITITWVPIELAKKGKKVTVEDWGGEWVIKSVGKIPIPGSSIEAMKIAHKYHRKRTDI